MIHFIKLIRPLNLIIIGLTMYGIRFYVLTVNYFQLVKDDPIHFLLLVFSTILIAAAGNIINDYFDVKADRINKPDKLIITKHIKRRWAILTHWIFNGIAFLIAVYLSVKYQSLWFVFIHLLSINLLWFYSMLFKRKVLIGNLIIAALTTSVPLLTVVYFKVGNAQHLTYSEFDPDSWVSIIDFRLIYLLAFFAFVQNLAREILKDIQDVRGDRIIYVKSLPMLIGETKSLRIIALILMILPLSYFIISIYQFNELLGSTHFLVATLPFLISSLINLIVIALLFGTKHVRIKLYDNLIKTGMLIGVLATFYLAYFHL